jgi:hypothetical protein
MFSEGIRIIVIKTFFATSFSDLFRLEINCEILPIDCRFNIPFSERKQLVGERIRDHITQNTKLIIVSLMSRTASWRRSNSLEKSSASGNSKNRSPYVWRK